MKSNSIVDKASEVYKRVSRAAMKADRNPEEVSLVAVTKGIDLERIIEAIDAGLRIFGENRIQEARAKIENLLRLSTADYRLPAVSWHLIGHLQRNKAKYAVQIFDLIHSIDSADLAEEVNRQAERVGKIQEVLIEVKLSPEETKHGVSRDELIKLLTFIKDKKNLNLRGLMAIPFFFDNPEETRPCYRELRVLRDEASAMGFDLPELSMGMSNDFEVAIEEGATMVRLGTAIFGERKR